MKRLCRCTPHHPFHIISCPSAKPTVSVRFATRLREMRLKRGLSVEQLAASARVHPEELVLLESAGEEVSLETLYTLAQALEVKMDELVSGI